MYKNAVIFIHSTSFLYNFFWLFDGLGRGVGVENLQHLRIL